MQPRTQLGFLLAALSLPLVGCQLDTSDFTFDAVPGAGGATGTGGSGEGGSSAGTSAHGGKAGGAGFGGFGGGHPIGGAGIGGSAGLGGHAGTSAGSGGSSGQGGSGATGGLGGGGGSAGSSGVGGSAGTGGSVSMGGSAGTGGGGAAGGHAGAGGSGTGGTGGGTCTKAPSSGGIAVLGQACDAAGSHACNGHAQPIVLDCDPTTCTWTTLTTCDTGGLCDSVSAICNPIPADCMNAVPGSSTCIGQSRVTCNQDLTGKTSVMCADTKHCQQGTGDTCAVCVDGEFQCMSMDLYSCASDHSKFDLVKTCSVTAPCNDVAGDCTSMTCTPNQFTCASDTLHQCNTDGSGFASTQMCSPGLCDAANGRCDTCSPGAATCADSTTQSVCQSDGVTTLSVPCTVAAPFCVQSGGVGKCVGCTNDLQCPPTGNECVLPSCNLATETCGSKFADAGTHLANQTMVCVTMECDGGGGVSNVPDMAGTTCVGGVCNGDGACGDCIPGATRCGSGGSTVETCATSGQWATSFTCSGTTPLCDSTTLGCFGITEIGIGTTSTCALATDGRVFCWGNNGNGQLGQSTPSSSPTPVLVPGITTATAIAVGSQFACAITSSTEVQCWGQNSSGSLGRGNGTATGVYPPGLVDLSVLGGAQLLSHLTAGANHACVDAASGHTACWGDNFWGVIGNGDTTDHPKPVLVSIPGGGVYTGDEETCFLDSSSYPNCWGSCAYGGCGNVLDPAKQPSPFLVKSVAFASVAVVSDASCGVENATGSLYCWGGNSFGELGTNFVPAQTATPTFAQSAVAKVVGGSSHFLTLGQDSTVRCFGNNASSQCGSGAMLVGVPTAVAGVPSATSVAAGESTSCAITTSGVYCWGDNSLTQIGPATLGASVTTPYQISF